MARSQFGGRSEQVGVQVAADQSLKLGPNAVVPDFYDKPLYDGTRAVVTDFTLDNAGSPGTATSTLTTDDSGIPPFFWGPDGVTILYDEAGHAFYANRGTDGSVVSATETTAGIAEISTAAEADTGADHTRIMPPDMVKRRIDAHNADLTSHQDLRDQVTQNSAAIPDKADLVSGLVPMAELPVAQGATGSMIVQRRATGGTAVGTAALDDEAVTKLQMTAAIAAGVGGGADVRDLPATATPSVPQTATGTASWVTVAGPQVTDAASGQKFKMGGQLRYRSTAVAGIKVRFKVGAAAVTNQLLNPSFATDATNWNPSGTNTIVRATALTAQDGTGYGLITSTGAITIQVFSEWKPTTPGVPWSAGGYAQLVTGTAKVMRADAQYGDAAGAVVRSVLGTNVTPAGSWSRSLASGDTAGGPAGTTQVRTRIVYVNPAASDQVAIDAIQLEPSSVLPAYGSTGGSGSTAYTIDGKWGAGPIVATPTTDSYTRVIPIEYPTDSNLTAAFGGLGATTTGTIPFEFDVTIGGTGLTNQRIEFEFADNASDGSNHASIRGGIATFARVA